jgi:hypothetical protein
MLWVIASPLLIALLFFNPVINPRNWLISKVFSDSLRALALTSPRLSESIIGQIFFYGGRAGGTGRNQIIKVFAVK